MPARDNQHFVPKYLLRFFAPNRHRIHRLDKKTERINLNASIRKECARYKFYGNAEVESLLDPLESQQSTALRQLREMVWAPLPIDIESIPLARIWEAVVLQRARTELEAEKHSAGIESFWLEVLKRHAKHAAGVEDREALVGHLERGDIRITVGQRTVIGLSLCSALKNTLLISDLDLYVLRNQTDYPFLLGDSPVVFYNTYYRNVSQRGVLGFTTPGLQIFFPIDPRTLLMLVDGQVYDGPFRESLTVDIAERSDVSQLNALQLHHSLNAVYFADAREQEYVLDLWNAHKGAVVQPRSRFEARNGWLVDGKPVNDGLYIEFEPHLNIKLALSFIKCTPINPSQYVFRRRSPELYEEYNKRGRSHAAKKQAANAGPPIT